MKKSKLTTDEIKESARKLNECSYIISVKKSEKEVEVLPIVKKHKERQWMLRDIIKH